MKQTNEGRSCYLPINHTSMLNFLFRSLVAMPLICLFTSFSTGIKQNLKVTVKKLKSNTGVVLISLFKEGVGYPDEPAKAWGKEKAYIVDKSATIIFKSVPPGNYAIAILHDENSNQKMDKNILGIPKEGYGFSNNATGTFGPPSIRKASFVHTDKQVTAIQIKAKYF